MDNTMGIRVGLSNIKESSSIDMPIKYIRHEIDDDNCIGTVYIDIYNTIFKVRIKWEMVNNDPMVILDGNDIVNIDSNYILTDRMTDDLFSIINSFVELCLGLDDNSNMN